MSHSVCPAWMSFVLANPLRRWRQDPVRILAPYLAEGNAAADIGCGPGFFTVAMAQLVGPLGRVVAVDIQPAMIEKARRAAQRAGVGPRIEFRQAAPDSLCLTGPLDFALAFAVVHELPDAARALVEIAAALRSGGRLLISEPRLHVSEQAFGATLRTAEAAGLERVEEPRIAASRSALLRKQ